MFVCELWYHVKKLCAVYASGKHIYTTFVVQVTTFVLHIHIHNIRTASDDNMSECDENLSKGDFYL